MFAMYGDTEDASGTAPGSLPPDHPEPLAVDAPPLSDEVDGHQELGCKTYTFVIYVIVFGLMCVLGLIGNTLSFIVLHFDRQSHAATFLLQVMAVVDNLFLISTGMSQIFTSMVLFMGMKPSEHWLNPYLQTFVWPFVHIMQLSTVCITVLIACNRYIAICHPYKAERLCSLSVVKGQVMFLFGFVFAYNVPRFFEYQFPCTTTHNATLVNASSVSSSVRHLSDDYCETLLKKNEIYKIAYENVLYCIVVFLGPLVLLIFFNIALISELVQSHRDRRQSSGSLSISNHAEERRERNNITLVMVVIIIVFLVTQTPAYVNQVLFYFLGQHEYQCGHAYFYYYHVSNVVVSSNSSLNFVVYCVCRRNFRERLRSLLFAAGRPCGEGGGCYSSHRDSLSTTATSAAHVAVTRSLTATIENGKTSGSSQTGIVAYVHQKSSPL